MPITLLALWVCCSGMRSKLQTELGVITEVGDEARGVTEISQERGDV